MPHSCPNAHLLDAIPIRCWPVLLLLLWLLLLHVCYSTASQQSCRFVLALMTAPVSQGDLPQLHSWNLSRSRTNGTRAISPPWLLPTPFTWITKAFLLGPTTSQCLSVSHIASGPFPLTTEIKTKYKVLNEEEMTYNLPLSLVLWPQIFPTSSCFQNAHTRHWQTLCV